MLGNMTLGALIKQLETMDQGLVVKNGFSTPHSDRGDYSELAFHPEPKAKVSDMLAHAKSAVGNKFMGWKGGEYTMTKYTSVYIGEYGECGEEITSATFAVWELSKRIAELEATIERVRDELTALSDEVRWASARDYEIDAGEPTESALRIKGLVIASLNKLMKALADKPEPEEQSE